MILGEIFDMIHSMNGKKSTNKPRNKTLPLFVEKDEKGFYVVECPLFEGCYTQGRTLDQALSRIREVILLALEDKANKEILRHYRPEEISLHTMTL